MHKTIPILSIEKPPPLILLCNLILTKLYEIWKTASKDWKMQNGLKKIENEKRPQKCLKWRTTSKNLKMEDDFKKILNGRRSQKI